MQARSKIFLLISFIFNLYYTAAWTYSYFQNSLHSSRVKIFRNFFPEAGPDTLTAALAFTSLLSVALWIIYIKRSSAILTGILFFQLAFLSVLLWQSL
jgi:hypothetical protein